LETQIIQVPYDSGQKDFGMGNGPAHLVRHGLASLPGVGVGGIEVEQQPFEWGTTLRVLSALAEEVGAAAQGNRFALVLAGNCMSSVGTLAGLSAPSPARSLGIVWLDAHADFNTPETTVSGFLDGMALATATGRCWQNLTASIHGFRPVLEKNVVLIGARDLDREERNLLRHSAVASIDAATLRKRSINDVVAPAIEAFAAESVYLHIDLDVLDRSEARVNEYSSSGGLTLAELLEIVRVVGAARPLAAAAITAYDPAHDNDGKALRAATALIKELVTISRQSLARADG